MTTDHSRQRRASLGAIFVVIGALVCALTLETAGATVSTAGPEVQIGESRSIERPAPTIATQADEAAVANVAVAGVAIARAAPRSPYRNGTNPLPLIIGLTAEAAMIASLWLRSRRTVA